MLLFAMRVKFCISSSIFDIHCSMLSEAVSLLLMSKPALTFHQGLMRSVSYVIHKGRVDCPNEFAPIGKESDFCRKSRNIITGIAFAFFIYFFVVVVVAQLTTAKNFRDVKMSRTTLRCILYLHRLCDFIMAL